MKQDATVKIVNLTGHRIDILDETGQLRVFQPSGIVARAELKHMPLMTVNGICVNAPTWNEIIGLPAPQKNTIYVVSRMVKNLIPGRYDVVCPGERVVDERKRVVGANGFLL